MSWKATLQEVVADRRRAMGDRPSLDKLIDLREGRLSADERESVLERAAVDPEVAHELLDTLDYPALPPAEDEPDGEQRADRWRRFQERLRTEDQGSGGSLLVFDRRAENVPGHDRHGVFRPSRWMRLAATFLVGTLAGALGVQTLHRPATKPASTAGNVEIVSLSFDREPASRGGRVELLETAEWVLLTFGSARLPPATDYAILVLDATDKEVWRRTGLVVGTGGLLTVLVPAEILPPGGYRAEVYPESEFEREPAATATWTVDGKNP